MRKILQKKLLFDTLIFTISLFLLMSCDVINPNNKPEITEITVNPPSVWMLHSLDRIPQVISVSNRGISILKNM